MQFIHKYKPKTLDDFEMPKDFINSLKHFIEIDFLNLILTGNTDTGKTTMIQVLIKEYFQNIEPSLYNKNILYISNSMDQGIQYYRNELKIFCQTCSVVPNKKKMVIIDDIDHINDNNQQVFRNCMDKYNKKVMFLFTASNLQKVIESIQSRQILMRLRNMTTTTMTYIYDDVMKNEKIKITDEAKSFLIKISQHSPRVMLNYLEAFKMLHAPIDIKVAYELCTCINYQIFHNYIHDLKNNNLNQAIQSLYNLTDMGFSVMDIYDSFFNYLKTDCDEPDDFLYVILNILCKYIYVFHEIHENEVELVLFTNNVYKEIKKITS
jgi:DNA polymerase III delta prime subunit